MQVALGDPIVSVVPTPAGPPESFGARVEVPITRAIVGYWQPGVLTDGDAFEDAYWTAELEPVVDAGDYLLVWMTPDTPTTVEWFVPLIVTAGGASNGGGSPT